MSERIIRNSGFVLALIVFGKLLSFLRDIIISSNFGATFQSDAYFAANNVPSLIFTAILSSYLVLLIPTYKRIQTDSGISDANLFASRVINIFLIVSVALSVLGIVFIEPLIYFVAPGFDENTHKMSVLLGKILLFSFPFSSATNILATVSNANNKYYAPHIIPVFSSLFIIVSVFLFAGSYGIIVLAVSGVLAFVFQLGIQIFISRKHFKYTLRVRLVDEDIKRMSILVLPVFLGFSIDQINLLVNSIICSNLTEGSLSSLNYAQRLQATISGTVSTAIITVIYPLISKLASEKNYEYLNEIVRNGLKWITLILTPIVIFLAINSTSFISVVYFRGKFDLNALDKTTAVFFFYSFNVLFLSLREFILRLYYVSDNTRIPFLTSLVSLLINIVLSLLLVKVLDVAGLSLATMVATIASIILLFLFIPTKTSLNLKSGAILSYFKTISAPMLIFIVLQIVQFRFFSIGGNLLVFIMAFIVSGVEFFILLLVFKIKEASLIINIIKSKISNVHK